MLIKSITLQTTCIYINGAVIFCNRSIESLKKNHLMQIYFCNFLQFLTIVMTAQGTSNGSATVENDLCSLKDWCWHLRYLLLRGYLEWQQQLLQHKSKCIHSSAAIRGPLRCHSRSLRAAIPGPLRCYSRSPAIWCSMLRFNSRSLETKSRTNISKLVRNSADRLTHRGKV